MNKNKFKPSDVFGCIDPKHFEAIEGYYGQCEIGHFLEPDGSCAICLHDLSCDKCKNKD